MVELIWLGFNIVLNSLQIISQTIFPANRLTGAEQSSAFSTNHETAALLQQQRGR